MPAEVTMPPMLPPMAVLLAAALPPTLPLSDSLPLLHHCLGQTHRRHLHHLAGDPQLLPCHRDQTLGRPRQALTPAGVTSPLMPRLMAVHMAAAQPPVHQCPGDPRRLQSLLRLTPGQIRPQCLHQPTLPQLDQCPGDPQPLPGEAVEHQLLPVAGVTSLHMQEAGEFGQRLWKVL